MGVLLELKDVSLAFGRQPVLDRVSVSLQAGDRIGLLGRNGEGKSSLLKVLAGAVPPDSGELLRSPGLRVGLMPQDVLGIAGSVFEVLAGGLGPQADALVALHRTGTLAHDDADDRLWQWDQRIAALCSKLCLTAEADYASLSGGMKRRVLLGRALVQEPELLLLDEPTNHLDLDTISWMESFLAGLPTTVLFVSHDRSFLDRLATRIWELDRGRLDDYACGYSTYLQRRETLLAEEENSRARLDKKLAAEEVWIRQGIKARRTRNMGRVRALQALREQVRQRRDRQGKAQMAVEEAERSGRLVVEAQQAGFAYGGHTIVRELTTRILRGDKVGIIGPNGAGKTTLLRLLLGELQPQQGLVRQGTNLQVLYFDQMRDQLDPDKSLVDNLAGGADRLTVGGQTRHVIGYLQDFLFSAERARSPVRILSGGERNRLLLAKLLAQPANVLVLDEPTNDLDMETLDILEEQLVNFAGTVLLVSHDRTFLNNVVSSTLVFEGDGRVQEYPGGYDDWLRQRPTPAPVSAKEAKTPAARPRQRSRRLSYREQRELDQLPAKIEAIEEEHDRLTAALADPAVAADAERLVALSQELQQVSDTRDTLYARWQELEELQAGTGGEGG